MNIQDAKNKTVFYFDYDSKKIERVSYYDFVREFGNDETTTPNGVAPRKFVQQHFDVWQVMTWGIGGRGPAKLLETFKTKEAAEQEVFDYWEWYMMDSDQTPSYYDTKAELEELLND